MELVSQFVRIADVRKKKSVLDVLLKILEDKNEGFKCDLHVFYTHKYFH